MKTQNERELGFTLWTPKIQFVKPRASSKGRVAQKGWATCSRTLSGDAKMTLWPLCLLLTQLQPHWPRHITSCLPQGPCTGYSLSVVFLTSTFRRLAPFHTHFLPLKSPSERLPGLSGPNHFLAYYKPIFILCIASSLGDILVYAVASLFILFENISLTRAGSFPVLLTAVSHVWPIISNQ